MRSKSAYGGGQSHAGFQAGQQPHGPVPGTIGDFAVDLVQRQIEIDGLREEMQSGREDSDDFVRLAVELQSGAHHAWISAQFADPELIVEYEGRGGARPVVVSAEQAAQHGVRANQTKEAVSDHAGARQQRLGTAIQGEMGGVEASHVFEAAVFAAPMLVVDPGDADALGLRVGFAQPHQPFRGGVWQGTQQDRVHHAEDGGVRADAQSQGQNHDQRKTGRPADAAQAVAEVLGDGFESWEPPGIAGAFLDLREIADVAPRRPASLFGRHALRDVLFDFKFEVGIDLGVEITSQGAPPSEGAAQFRPAFAEHMLTLGRQDTPHGFDESLPAGGGGYQLFTPGTREAVVSGAAAVGRTLPLRRDPVTLQQALQGGI